MASPSTPGLHPGAAASSKSLDDEKLTIVADLRASTGPKPDAGVLVAALYANKQPPIIEYVCTQLARCDVRDLEFFVPQLWFVSRFLVTTEVSIVSGLFAHKEAATFSRFRATISLDQVSTHKFQRFPYPFFTILHNSYREIIITVSTNWPIFWPSRPT